jgi:RHH-type proline utilization regulon transcriptional repressor/proline dehydrogenase/delta 1-pyrroline-5-carboxylate dehydrogenase
MTRGWEDFSERDLARIEAATQEVGRHLFAQRPQHSATIFQRRWWDDRIMAWAMADEAVKVQMFRFVDALPMLKSSESVTRHLHEYFHEVDRHLPGAVRLGLSVATPDSVAGRALAITARRNANGYARRFIAGSNVAEVLVAAMRERKQRRAFTLDILGEAVASDVEAERYLQLYLDLIEQTSPTINAWPEVPQIDRSEFATLPRVNVSVKLSALDCRFDAIDPVGTTERVAARLRRLFRVARQHGAQVHVDMESYDKKDLTLHIFKQVLGEDEFRDWADIGIVIQCYLKDAERDLLALRDWAIERGTGVWVRLVKGAYWDYETVLARQRGWPVPVFEEKWQSDVNFERLTRLVMRQPTVLRPAIASHNIRSLAHAIAVARHAGIPLNAFELQMLYGMADEEKQALVELGHRLRIYMPYGELLPGMAYLVRRLLENTSNDSFLKAAFQDHASPEALLMNPKLHAHHAPSHAAKHASPPSTHPTGHMSHFTNTPPTDFGLAVNRDAQQAALDQVRTLFGRHEPLMIDGHAVDTKDRLESFNPSHDRELLGTTAAAGVDETNRAVAAAQQAWRAWNARPIDERAACLDSAADIMEARRFELAAWITHECGKPWREADGDVAEAIDFCRYYAASARELQAGGLDVPGEENRFVYMGRGVAAVIAPWNFPLAILTGMTVAALVTGNTVIMKPAEQSPLIAARLYEILREAGVPASVIHYLPGHGEVCGARLVDHPHVALIAFTGSRQVGLAIHRRAAEVSAGGITQIKRVIAEMGGKNAIIVDDDADLDEAVIGVMHSAFGYLGQKCSACSRVIVLDAVHDAFCERLVEATRSLSIGPAELPGTQIGPLIDSAAVEKVRRYIDVAHGEGRTLLAVDVGPLGQEGNFIGPHIFADVKPTCRIAQEEIFGPVLGIIRAANFADALDIANGTDYALTGGVFSRSPEHLEQARREMQVGNLYLNRGITGALVGRQPFGGFRMSGIGSKAGGPDYLLQFVVPKTITENTMRRGFVPAE